MFLYALYLGGKAKGANIEVHDVVFLISVDLDKDKQKIKDLWFGDKSSVHIDAIARIDGAGGYKVVVLEDPEQPQTHEDKLYFINFGASGNGTFDEKHEADFFVANSRQEAIKQAKEKLFKGEKDVHLDNFLDIDNCLDVSDLVKGQIKLVKENGYQVIIENVYKKL